MGASPRLLTSIEAAEVSQICPKTLLREAQAGADGLVQIIPAPPPTSSVRDPVLEIFIEEQRHLHAAGQLPAWKISRFEAISGWTW